MVIRLQKTVCLYTNAIKICDIFSKSGIWHWIRCHRPQRVKDHDLDSNLEIDGFRVPFSLDIDPAVTGTWRGLCLYVNQNWYNTVVIRDSLCTWDIELLSVSLCPFYLPREFPQPFVTLVYIHPKANVDMATQAMTKAMQHLQRIAPDTPVLINVVYLVLTHKSVLRRNKVERILVPGWAEESIQCLQECFSSPDRDVLRNVCGNVDGPTGTVSAYIVFCEEMIIPRKSISIYSNNKPWVSKSVKNIIDQRNISFILGNMTQHRGLINR